MTSNDEEGVNQSEGNPLDDGEKQLRNTRTYAFFTYNEVDSPIFNYYCCGDSRYGCTRTELKLSSIACCFCLIPLLVFLCFSILPVIYVPSPIQPLSTNPPKTTATIKVLLVGDSMWGIPSRRMNIVGKIRAYLPQYSMNISVR